MTTRRKKILSVAALAIAAFMLTGCGTDVSGDRVPERHYTFQQELPDGGTVLCVWAKNGYGGGLSCDWGGVS